MFGRTPRKSAAKMAPGTPAVTHSSAFAQPESWMELLDADRVAYIIRAARGGSVDQLFALYRDIVIADNHIQVELHKRKLAVLGEVCRYIPLDKAIPADVEAAAYVESICQAGPFWITALSHLLDAVLWPVAVAEKIYQSSGAAGYRLENIIPVPPYLLDFSSGRLRIKATDPDGSVRGELIEPDPSRYIIHRGHLLSAPDNYGGPMRSLIYWHLGSAMNRDWWIRFLDRYGMPFVVGKFEAGNTTDRNILLAAFSAAKKVFGLAVSSQTQIEVVEASKSGADAFEKFHTICQREKSKTILGQTLSVDSQATGMGSGVADLQMCERTFAGSTPSCLALPCGLSYSARCSLSLACLAPRRRLYGARSPPPSSRP